MGRLGPGLVLALVALFAWRQVASPDIGFHLRAGDHILSGRGFPRTDAFTYTSTGRPYVDTSWGYQVLIGAVERVAGSAGLVLLHVLLTLATFTLVLATARRSRAEPAVVAALLLLGGIAVEPRLEVRPELLSYALLALVLYLLERRARGSRTPLALLPVIFLVWTNVHGLVVLGWIALGAFVLGDWLARRRLDRALALWALASLAVGLINPYGWRALTFPLVLATRFGRGNVLAQNIGEFASPLAYLTSDQRAHYLASLGCLLAFGVLVALSLVRLWREREFQKVALALAFAPLALGMIRNVPPFVVACLPGTAGALSLERLLRKLGTGERRYRSLERATLAVIALGSLALALRVVNDAYYIAGRRLERFGLGWNRLALPIEAAEYVRAARPSGRMLNHLNFGGFLMWATREPVFIDGRLELTGEAFYEEYRRALDSPAGLEAAVARWQIGWIVFPFRLRPDLLAHLSRSPDWELVHVDSVAAIFARAGHGAEADASVREVERPVPSELDLRLLPGLGGPARAGRLAHWARGLALRERYPVTRFSRGVFHYLRGEAWPAAHAFGAAIRESRGAYYEMYNNLGAALLAAGRTEEARACRAIYLADLPFYRQGVD